MGLYNFQSRFVPKILAGEKTHTIRGDRAYPDVVGDIMHLYTGLRTKKARLLMRRECVKVEPIAITRETAVVDPPSGDAWEVVNVIIGDERLSPDECNAFARRDGFESFGDMMEFWRGRLPFYGCVYHWRFERERKVAA